MSRLPLAALSLASIVSVLAGSACTEPADGADLDVELLADSAEAEFDLAFDAGGGTDQGTPGDLPSELGADLHSSDADSDLDGAAFDGGSDLRLRDAPPLDAPADTARPDASDTAVDLAAGDVDALDLHAGEPDADVDPACLVDDDGDGIPDCYELVRCPSGEGEGEGERGEGRGEHGDVAEPCAVALGPGRTLVRADLRGTVEMVDFTMSLDTTGSMAGAIDAIERVYTQLADEGTPANGVDYAFGMATFADFPLEEVGEPGDLPYRVAQRVTTDLDTYLEAFEAIRLTRGGDVLEAGIECLYQIATGEGVSWMGPTERGSVPPFDPLDGFDPAAGHGTLGGLGFREGALPVVNHITDAPSHLAEDYLAIDPTITAHTHEETVAALRAIGARLIGGAGSADEAPDLDPRSRTSIAWETRSVVPMCAFDGTEPRRTGECDEDQCCSYAGGTVPYDDGTCPFYSAGLLGRPAQFDYLEMTVSPRLVDLDDDGLDPLCLVRAVEVSRVSHRDDCAFDWATADLDERPGAESVLRGMPRSRVTWDLDLRLGAAPCVPPGTYRVALEARGDGGVRLGSRVLELVVPE